MKYRVRYSATFEENVHAPTPGKAMEAIRIPEKGGRYVEESCRIESCEKVQEPSRALARGERRATKKGRGIYIDHDNLDVDKEFVWLDVLDGKGRECSVSIMLRGDGELEFEVYDEPRSFENKREDRVYDDPRWQRVCTDPFSGFNRGGESMPKSPYALKTNPGDRFVVQGDELDWRGEFPAEGMNAEDVLILMEAKHIRHDDIWGCSPVSIKDAGSQWGYQGFWEEAFGKRTAMVLTDGEVQTRVEGSKEALKGPRKKIKIAMPDKPIVVPEDGMSLSLPDDVVDITLCMPSGKRFRVSCHPDAEADSFEIVEEDAETDLTEILIWAWEPNGCNAHGGFEWTYIHGGEEDNDEFMARMSKATIEDAKRVPEQGGMVNFHYIIYGYAPSEMSVQDVTDRVGMESPWLAKGRLKEPYVVGQPMKLEHDPG